MEASPSGDPFCPNCKAVLPPHAAFCAFCGERIVNKNSVPLLQNETDISARYRITSLIRRRLYVSLFFALDTQQQRRVAIREINIRDLNDEARAKACEAVQREYDLLRREHIHGLMPVIDLQYFQGYLYVIAGWQASASRGAVVTQFQTLQDLLQSGIGLPDTQVVLSWTEQICQTLAHLHRHSIVLGDLDPRTLILGGNGYDSELALMISWLPSSIRDMLSPIPVINTTNFSAPEALLGKPEARSDIYSLGAVLYLLLTGITPEEPTPSTQRRLRSPGEVNSRIKSDLDEFVMKALSTESSQRYQSAEEMLKALQHLRSASDNKLSYSADAASSSSSPLAAVEVKARSKENETTGQEQKIAEIVNTDTVVVKPERDFAGRQVSGTPESSMAPHADKDLAIVAGKLQGKPEGELSPQVEEMQASSQQVAPGHNNASTKNAFVEDFKKRITGILPAIRIPVNSSLSPRQSSTAKIPTIARAAPATYEPAVEASSNRDNKSLLKQLQRIVLGEQKHNTMVAAIIETPLRVQPNQSYAIRIQLMGRNEAGFLHDIPLQSNMKKSTQLAGLSALVEGELVYIEVRSALYQSYAYIVQQAAVSIPAQGYAAEVTIPMQPLSSGPSGRRERLHIFFMDELHRPLYEKPFVVELFISHLVQPGREGHNVLTIPL